MAKASISCKETDRKVVLYLNVWEDEFTGLESLKDARCAYQQNCEFFDRKTSCPTLEKVRRYYSSGKKGGKKQERP